MNRMTLLATALGALNVLAVAACVATSHMRLGLDRTMRRVATCLVRGRHAAPRPDDAESRLAENVARWRQSRQPAGDAAALARVESWMRESERLDALDAGGGASS